MPLLDTNPVCAWCDERRHNHRIRFVQIAGFHEWRAPSAYELNLRRIDAERGVPRRRTLSELLRERAHILAQARAHDALQPRDGSNRWIPFR